MDKLHKNFNAKVSKRGYNLKKTMGLVVGNKVDNNANNVGYDCDNIFY